MDRILLRERFHPGYSRRPAKAARRLAGEVWPEVGVVLAWRFPKPFGRGRTPTKDWIAVSADIDGMFCSSATWIEFGADWVPLSTGVHSLGVYSDQARRFVLSESFEVGGQGPLIISIWPEVRDILTVRPAAVRIHGYGGS